MKNNETQVKSGGLPIISKDEQIQRNSMRLYIYLVSISTFKGKNQPRVFSQRDFTLNGIKKMLGMHYDTIKKYWRLLEDNKLIKYEGPASENIGEILTQDEWNKKFMARKKLKATFYSVPKKKPYRIMPKETIEKMQKEFLIEESELKLYLLLANMQEHFCFMLPEERIFNMADLRELLGLTKHTDNNKKIALNLMWLQKLNLVEYVIEDKINNLGEKDPDFHLVSVNYYTDGGEAVKYIGQQEGKLSSEIKTAMLNDILIDFEE